jgi:hypothetical protein
MTVNQAPSMAARTASGLMVLPVNYDTRDHPSPFAPRAVLDQSAQRQRARSGSGTRLFVGQSEHRRPQRIALLRQEGQQRVSLVSDATGKQGHLPNLAGRGAGRLAGWKGA